MSEIQVPSPPAFNASCLGDNQRGTLRVCNTSGGDLVVSAITSSNPEFTIVRPVGRIPGHHQPRLLLPVRGRVHADRDGDANDRL